MCYIGINCDRIEHVPTKKSEYHCYLSLLGYVITFTYQYNIGVIVAVGYIVVGIDSDQQKNLKLKVQCIIAPAEVYYTTKPKPKTKL